MADQHSIILSGGTPAEVAPAMAKLFAIDPKLAGQIAGAAPIVLVENLTAGQASGVRAALDELVSAGGQVEVKAGSVGSIPKVGWGGVPKIAGKPADQYTPPAPPAAAPGAPGTFCCPACGATFSLFQAGAAAAAAPAAPAPAPAKMTAKDSGFEEIPLPDALKALESPPDLPDVPEIPAAPPAAQPAAAAPAPEPAPAPVGGAIPISKVKPGHSAPMALEDFEKGLASDDSLLADLDDGLPNVPDEPPRPVPAKRTAKKPLANVNVQGLDEIEVAPLGAPPPAARPAAPAAKAAPKARPAAPKAKAAAAPKAKAAPVAKAAPAGAGGGDPNEKVNIFANRSNNPKLIELLAKIRGVSREEAQELAAKPLVTVAKNISRKQAEVIRRKFGESSISVRLTPTRASQRMKPPDIDL